MTTRRQFVRAAAATPLLGLGAVLAQRSQSPDSRIDVLLDEEIGTIAPEIYGHFVEHLGAVVYDGIWVGEDSPVANVGGIRKELADALRKVKSAVIRWPGGCFADQYDWHDGIGPRDKRPKRTNFWADSPEWPKSADRKGPQMYDPNAFGTIEFARFCRLTGSQPYFASNLRSLPAQDFWRWIEYANAPAGTATLAGQRAADGEPDPLNVRFWGVGNESWGCGGEFSPEDYATEFRRFTAWTPSYGQRLSLVASGPNDGNTEWTRGFFTKVARGGALNHVWGWAMHHYSWNASAGRTQNWFAGKGDAVAFDPVQYYEILREANETEELIETHWKVMGESDPDHRVKLVVDEWGSWYKPGTEPFPEALLGQQNTMRDAVLAGLSLDIFNRHADKVAMACIAQLVNCLQSLFFAHENKFCVTPTYHVFDMYAAHQGGRSVRMQISSPAVTYARISETAKLPALAGSASKSGSKLTLTVTNLSIDQPREAEILLRGATPKSASTVTLAAADVHAHNSFAQPHAVEPRQGSITVRGPVLVHTFPPASVTKITIAL